MSLIRSRAGLMVLAGVISMFVLAVGSTGIAQADVFDVTHQTDTSQGDDSCLPGDCSLRQAVEAANNSSGDDDTINVPAGTYLLDNGRLRIDQCSNKLESGAATITGAGARDTIVDGQANDRVFKIYCGVATITDLTVQNGLREFGAGIWVRAPGDLTLQNVAVIDNTAVCTELIAPETDTNIFPCAFGSAGGGIHNDGTLSASQSLVADNIAVGGFVTGGFGGGIFNQGLMTLTNITLTANEAQDGFGICLECEGVNTESDAPGLGGAIYQVAFRDANEGATNGVAVQGSSGLNLTIVGNTAGLGGGISTVSFLSGQDELPAVIALKNTIVANNEAVHDLPLDSNTNATSGQDNCFVVEGSLVSNGHNLESDVSCDFTASGDKQNTEPGTGALANNGGPTNTMALNDGSQALDTADNSACPGTDQRYVTRPQGPVCDIGAYEREVAGAVTPPATVAPAVAQAKPVAKSSISGPRRCTRGKATVRVSGENISSVTYSLDGKKVKTAKGNKTKVTVNLKNKKSGVHRITAKVSYTAATSAKAQTRRFTVSRCARAAVKPKFTG